MADTLTISETARRLGVSRDTVYLMIRKGQQTIVAIGERDRVLTASVDRLLTLVAEEEECE